jgi:hypothetical protein
MEHYLHAVMLLHDVEFSETHVIKRLKHENHLNNFKISVSTLKKGARGGAMVEALRYKPEGRVIDS